MNVYSEVLGNVNRDSEWLTKLESAKVHYIYLDQWTAQKSRFKATDTEGNEYAIAFKRGSQILDGDIIAFDPHKNEAVILKIELSPVLVVDMSKLASKDIESVIRISLELGHAIGNQHWPAVIKGTTAYVPLTVAEKVMLSVLATHNIEGINYSFKKGQEILSLLAPQEVRKLFGGAGQEGHVHIHDEHDHTHEHGDHGHEHGPHTHTH